MKIIVFMTPVGSVLCARVWPYSSLSENEFFLENILIYLLLTADLTGQHGNLTPSKQLKLPLVYPGDCVCRVLILYPFLFLVLFLCFILR